MFCIVHRHLASSGSHLQVRTAVVVIDISGHRFGLSGTSAYEPITCTNSGTYIQSSSSKHGKAQKPSRGLPSCSRFECWRGIVRLGARGRLMSYFTAYALTHICSSLFWLTESMQHSRPHPPLRGTQKGCSNDEGDCRYSFWAYSHNDTNRRRGPNAKHH